MSWLLLMWVSLTVLLMSEGTFYETIQQHLAPPGTNIQILGESFVSFTPSNGKWVPLSSHVGNASGQLFTS